MAKNMLADFDYDKYWYLLEEASAQDVKLVHTQNIFKHGGFTFAWRRCSEFRRNRMVEVAVTFCSPKDQFCRKIGALLTLDRFFSGSVIMVPAGSENSEEIVRKLRYMFGSL